MCSCLSILPKNLPNLWLKSFLYQIECKCCSSHLKKKERKIKIKLLEVWLITTVTLCQFTSIFTSYCKAYIGLHNGAKTLWIIWLYSNFKTYSQSSWSFHIRCMYRLIIFRESLLLTNLSKLDFSKQKYCHVSCLNDDNDKQKGHSKKIIKNLPHCEYK